MNVVVRTSYGEAEVNLQVHDAATTLGQVVQTVTGMAPPRVCVVDDRPVPSTSPLATVTLHTGSIISTADPDVRQAGVVELVQIAGRGAGSRVWLPAGTFLLGPGQRVNAAELDAATVSDPRVRLVVEPDSSVRATALSDGVRLDGVDLSPADASGVSWQAETLDTSGRAFRLVRDEGARGGRRSGLTLDGPVGQTAASDTIVFERPPRPAPEPPTPPLVRPAPRTSRRLDRATDEQFRRAVSTRWAEDRERLRRADPDLAEAVDLARFRDPSLWQRRGGDDDAFRVAIGLADLPWSPAIDERITSTRDREVQLDERPDPIIGALGPLPMVPVVVDLVHERGIGIVGPAASGRALLRGLLIGAAVTHGPAHLGVVILTTDERAPSWEWVKWLPHVHATGSRAVITSRPTFERWSRTVAGRIDPTTPESPSHVTLVVIDGPAWWRDRNAPLRGLFADETLPLRYIALAGTRGDVPRPCTTVVTSNHDDTVSVDQVVERRHTSGVLPFLATGNDALATARRLAQMDDPEVSADTVASASGSSPLSITELLQLDDHDPGTFLDRWSAAGTGAGVTVGRNDDGPALVELVTDPPPHVLVVGSVAAGNGRLLRSIVLSLAADHSPAGLQFVLVDGSGGGDSVADVLAGLPHVAGVVTQADRYGADRLLRSLRREVHRRHELMRASTGTEASTPVGSDAPTRLVVVVDQYVAFAAALTDFVASLVDVARDGAAVGLQLIVAARALPTLDADTADLIDLAGVRIGAGVQDEATSIAVVGTDSAAHVDVERPDRCTLWRRGAEPVSFTAATRVAPALPAPDVDIDPFVVAREPTAMERRLQRSQAEALAASDDAALTRLVGSMTHAAATLGLLPVHPIVPAPLPDHITMRAFFDAHPGDGVPLALIDDDVPTRSPLWWEPGHGDLLVAGPGRTAAALVVLALGVAERHSPDDVHLYLVDDDTGSLSELGGLPHCGATVAGDDADALGLFLDEEIQRRVALAAELGGPPPVAAAEPTIVVVIADVGALGEPGASDGGGALLAALRRLDREGRGLGVCTVVAAKERDAVPGWPVRGDRLVIQLDTPSGHGVAIPHGRAVRTNDGATVQLVAPPDDVRAAVGALHLEPPTERPARSVGRTSASDGDAEGTS